MFTAFLSLPGLSCWTFTLIYAYAVFTLFQCTSITKHHILCIGTLFLCCFLLSNFLESVDASPNKSFLLRSPLLIPITVPIQLSHIFESYSPSLCPKMPPLLSRVLQTPSFSDLSCFPSTLQSCTSLLQNGS